VVADFFCNSNITNILNWKRRLKSINKIFVVEKLHFGGTVNHTVISSRNAGTPSDDGWTKGYTRL
jgi:hypothetical protein